MKRIDRNDAEQAARLARKRETQERARRLRDKVRAGRVEK